MITLDALQHRLATMCLFVAVSESGEIAGTIACHVVHPEGGHLRGMAVLPSWQGSGIAEKLLNSAESELRAEGCSRISLDTTEPLVPAIRFYQKHGYRNSGKVTYFCGMRRLEFVKTMTG